jgi:hypothetical protein
MDELGVIGNGGAAGGMRPRTRIEKDAQNILKKEKVGLLTNTLLATISLYH